MAREVGGEPELSSAATFHGNNFKKRVKERSSLKQRSCVLLVNLRCRQGLVERLTYFLRRQLGGLIDPEDPLPGGSLTWLAAQLGWGQGLGSFQVQLLGLPHSMAAGFQE